MSMLMLLHLAILAQGVEYDLPERREAEFSPAIFYGECELHKMVDDARLAAAKAYPQSWELLLLPADIKEIERGLRINFRLPRDWVGGTPVVVFSKDTCEITGIYHEQ
ncbi:MAG: hypothetical protein ACOZAA_15295 [Pseudomonadota bacterium]